MSDVGVYKFTAKIQIKILAVLWRDQFSFNLYRDVVKPKYFSNAIHVDMCRIIFDYYNQYNLPPTADVLTEEVSTMCSKYKKKEKLLDEYNHKFMNPYIAAEHGYVDEVIMPEETREKIAGAFRMLRTKKRALPMKKHGNIPL